MRFYLPLLTLFALPVAAQQADGPINTPYDKTKMDLSQRPGDNFYDYAGGGWMKANPLTAEYAAYGQFHVLQENNQRQMRELIEEFANGTYESGTLQQKIGGIYRLAMDSVRRNNEGYEPVRPYLEAVEKVSSREELQLLTARLSHRGVGAFFDVGCDADLKNAAQNLVQISQGGLNMGDRDYYLNDDEPTQKIREAYKQYVARLFKMTGKTDAEAQSLCDAVLRIETAIAEPSYSRVKLRDVEGNYHKMALDDLLRDYPHVNWSLFFFQNNMPAFDEVSVNQPEAIAEVDRLLAEAPLEDLKAYLYFCVIDGAASKLSDDFRAATFDFYSRTMSGAEQDRPRWKRAVSAVEGVLGMALGKMYVEKYFPESSKKRMLELVANLQKALGERIDAQEWMSAETKKQAHEKLDAFYVKIGYPDEWMNYDGLCVDESLSYYENMTRAHIFLSDYYIKKRVNQPVDRNEWYMTPQTINAYYNPTTNEICFPAGILQPPFFDPAADDAANYGAIGVVIGHEMTHGFDDQGAQFDKDGNMRNWWTKEDAEAFKARTAVMARFFSKIEELPGLYLNGDLTLGENIADHGGLNIAYLALQHAMERQPLEKVDGFTPQQRFFLSYAFVWAQNIREELLRQYNKIDPHSPGRYRVNGALPHIDAWYDAFGITKKSKLYVPKKDRVNVW